MFPPRERFLRDEFHGLTLSATAQRGNLYLKGLSETEHTQVHESLRLAIDRFVTGYGTSVSEARHIANIVSLADLMSEKHRSVLTGGRFRIGSAQKALNLYLKYLWCAELIPTPPHCPFDARVIAKLPRAHRCNWTAIDDIASYERLVTAAHALAGDRSLSEWELDLYNAVSVAAVRGRRSIPALSSDR